jgi:hypothetical protein
MSIERNPRPASARVVAVVAVEKATGVLVEIAELRETGS